MAVTVTAVPDYYNPTIFVLRDFWGYSVRFMHDNRHLVTNSILSAKQSAR
jgi:hypothetical protein